MIRRSPCWTIWNKGAVAVSDKITSHIHLHLSFPLSEWFSPLQSYMLRISLEEGEILSVDRNLLDLLNYPEQSWRTCQLASFLCIADIPCLLSCLMRLQKRRHLIRSSGAGAVDPGQNAVEKKAEEERPLEDSPSKELMSERCMFRLRWAWEGNFAWISLKSVWSFT